MKTHADTHTHMKGPERPEKYIDTIKETELKIKPEVEGAGRKAEDDREEKSCPQRKRREGNGKKDATRDRGRG